jgi:hypothetical protein
VFDVDSDDESAQAHPYLDEIRRFAKAAERFKAATARARADRNGALSQPMTALLSQLKPLQLEYGGTTEGARPSRESVAGQKRRAPAWRRED